MALSRVNSKMVGAGDVSNAEHAYLNSISSNVQTQITGNNLPAVGSSGNVLTSDGSNWASQAAAGGGAWNVVSTVVASNSASLTITGINNTYSTYAIGFADMIPADANSGVVKLRLGTSSGILSGGSDYGYFREKYERGDPGFLAITAVSDSIDIKGESGGGVVGEGWAGLLYLHRTTTDMDPWICGQIVGTDSTDNSKGFGSVWGRVRSVVLIDRVQLFQASGNIESGRMTVWGLAHA